MNIRHYHASDEYRCLEIFDSNLPKYFAKEERPLFREALTGITEAAPYFVLEVEDEVVACGGVFANHEKRVAGLSWGMVHSNHHLKGIGSALAKFRLNWLDEHYMNYQHIINTAQFTEAFYARFGFETKEVIPDGWGPGLHKYVMLKKQGSNT